MSRTIAGVVLMALLGGSLPAAAADADASSVVTVVQPAALPRLAGDVDWSLAPVQLGGPKRGAVLPLLYGTLAGLNAFDAHSTTRGVAGGATEANPLMRAVVGNPAAIWAVKGGVTIASIAVAERLWRQHHRGSAIAVMVISNGMMAVVAARNASVIRQLR
jgi:uncharacterized protein DUF5658